MKPNERLAVLQLLAAVEELNATVTTLAAQGRLARTSTVSAMCRRTRELLATSEAPTDD